MKKLLFKIFIFALYTNYTHAQQESGRLPIPAKYTGNIKPVLIKDTTRVVISFGKEVFPKLIVPRIKYVEKDHEELEDTIPNEVLEKIKNLEKKKALIEKRKMLQRRNRVPSEDRGEANTSFPLNEGSAGCPPDNTVGVSRSGYIVAADNSQIGFYKEDGTVVGVFSYPDFFNPVRTGLGDNTSDPKVLYDYEANRFVFFIQINSEDSDNSECILAFSKSEDPMEGWNVYIFHHFRDKKPRWFDYPGLAYNETEVFLTGNLLGENKGNVIFQLDKNDGYNGREMNGLMWLDILQPGSNDRKATTIFPMQTIPTWFYEKDMLFTSITFSGSSSFYYYRINNRIDNSPELSKYELSISEYNWPANMSQKDTDIKLSGGFIKIRGGFFVDNLLYFVFAKPDEDGFNGIALVRLKIKNFEVKTKFFHDNQNSEYCYPNIAHSGDSKDSHKALLVYLRSGINHFPEVRIRKIKSNMSADGNSTTIQSSDSFCSHCKSDNKVRWGDYIGVQRKGTSNRFWIAGQTANNSNMWRSNLTKIEF
jgi:hypothetical protein